MDIGLKILYRTYWNSGGWTKEEPTPEDFDIAKSEGYMFDYFLDFIFLFLVTVVSYILIQKIKYIV